MISLTCFLKKRADRAWEEGILDLEIGAKLLGKFLILEKLGSGGMGSIYKARDESLTRDIVLKVMSSTFDREKALVRFQIEAKALGRLNHPNIARVYDFGALESGQAYLAIDYVEGMTLRQFVDSGNAFRLTLADKLDLFLQLCDAVKHAHDEGVIHRDIKPENIMMVGTLNESYMPILLDFGVAKLFTEDGEVQRVTTHGAIVGSPFFMSPEQVKAEAVTPASDQYSLGCVLFYLLAGRPPFQAETALETLAMHKDKAPPRLSDATGDQWANEIEEALQKLLSKDPRRRFADMRQTIEVFEDILNRESADEPDTSGAEPVAKTHLRRDVILGFAVACVGLTALIVCAPPDDNEMEQAAQTSTRKSDPVQQRVDEWKPLLKKYNRAFTADAGYDEELEILKTCKTLRKVKLMSVDFTDNAASYILNSPVDELDMSQTQVKTLEYVSKIKTLQLLKLDNTLVDDNALKKIEPLIRIHELKLNHTKVTDQALESFKKLTAMQRLCIEGTGFSQSAREELVREMPWCKVNDRPALTAELESEAMQASNQGRFEDAAKTYQEIVRLIGKKRKTNPAILAEFLRREATCWENVDGKNQEAIRAASRALEIAEQTGHDDFCQRSATSLAVYMDKAGKEDAAIGLRKKALEYAYRAFGADSDQVYSIVEALRIGYLGKGRNEDARATVLAWCRRLRDTVSTGPLLARALSNAGQSEFVLNNIDAAEKYCRESLKILQPLENHSDEDLPVLLQNFHYISCCCEKRHDFRGALDFSQRAYQQALDLEVPNLEVFKQRISRFKRLLDEQRR